MSTGMEEDTSLDDVGAPSCARCLVSMEVAGTVHRPFWSCGVCGAVRLA